MRITLVVIGKTSEQYLIQGIEQYVKRLKHYTTFSIVELPNIKSIGNINLQKEKEAELLLKYFDTQTEVILLDERGEQFSSVAFSEFINHTMNRSVKHLVFMVGGAFGFANSIKQQAKLSISLSAMTFSHQMVRLFFTEQLYRAFTIIKGEKYHNE